MNELTIKGTELTQLDGNTLFLRRTNEGALVSAKIKVTLEMKKKELYEVKGSFRPTVEGYVKLSRFSGLSEHIPGSIVVEGSAYENPHPERDKNTGNILRWNANIILFGYNPLGIMQVVASSTCLDLRAYFKQDLMGKVKKYPNAGCYGSSTPPADEIRIIKKYNKQTYKSEEKEYKIDFKNKPMKKYCVDPDGEMFLWVNLAHPEIQEVTQTYLQRQKKGDTMAMSIARRNAIAKHGAIATISVQPKEVTKGKNGFIENAIAEVYVYSVKNLKSRDEITDVCRKVAEGVVLDDVSTVNVSTDADITEVKETEEEVIDEQDKNKEEKDTMSEEDHETFRKSPDKVQGKEEKKK